MRSPSIDVELCSGESVPLATLYRDRPLALVFLRHLGCVFCRRHVHQLKRDPDRNIVFVTMSPPLETQAFASKLGAVHPFICDPQRRLFDAFGLKRATTRQIIAPRVILRSFSAVRYGMSKPPTDPLQLGGSFVIDTVGDVVWSRRPTDISDNATPADIASALEKASESALA